jgi:RND family efflux transporter MFP subunit
MNVISPQLSLFQASRAKSTRACLWIALLSCSFGAQARTISGLIYPLHDVTLSAGVAGVVMQRLVTPGQRVKENQVLLLLDDRLQAIESERRKVIFQDQSELVSVRERTKILSTLRDDSRAIFARTGSISKDELLRLDAEYLASKGRQEQLIEQKKRERLEYGSAERERLQRHITAPFAGVVTKVIPQVGEWAKPGDPIILLVDPSTAVLHLAIPHKDLGNLKVGSAQNITLDANSSVTQVTGRITFISPVADPASGLVEVKVTFSNDQLIIKPGIKGSIEIQSAAISR